MKIFQRIMEQHHEGHATLVDDTRYVSLAICGEAGELANKVKKQWAGYQPVDSLDIQRELADTVNYCLHMTIALGMTFEQLDELCVEKYEAFLKKVENGRLG